jgi:hydrogenase/urease accessory protein HupE
MTVSRIVLILLCAVFASVSEADAHEVRPGFLDLRETEPNLFLLTWKVPALGAFHLDIEPKLPASCQAIDEPITTQAGGAFVERSRVRCDHSLPGESIAIVGLQSTQTDVLVRIETRDGSVWNARLTPSAPETVLAARPNWFAVLTTYVGLGINHILFGIDHLLFVFCLLLLVHDTRKLLLTVTAFTVAHSITLAAATLGIVHVPAAPVEASVALSIVFLARELLAADGGDYRGVTHSYPWIVAFSFGLLHGLGFASALAEIGLPRGEIPLALFAFNIGVELGQLAFIAMVLFAWKLARMALGQAALDVSTRWAPRLAGYAVGVTAAFWIFLRLALAA